MKPTEKLTSANIRYLLTMKGFADSGKMIRGAYLAACLNYKKSSVHSMLETFLSLGLIEKAAGGIVCLTEKGTDTASRYQTYYSKLDSVIRTCFPDLEERENATLALLAEIPAPELEKFSTGQSEILCACLSREEQSAYPPQDPENGAA